MHRELQSKIGYQFKNIALLVEALSHPSLRGLGSFEGKDYERLEFLGDAVVSLVVTEILYEQFIDSLEGHLARMRGHLVSKETMGDIASRLNLGDYIHMSNSEEHAGGRGNASNLENVLEAIMGAVYLDGGLEAAKEIICRLWSPLITADLVNICDPKSFLQERLQDQKLGLPHYELTNKIGPPHAPEFCVRVSAANGIEAQGWGKSLKSAEKDAASKLILKLGPQDDTR